jgi:hypothetical protein
MTPPAVTGCSTACLAREPQDGHWHMRPGEGATTAPVLRQSRCHSSQSRALCGCTDAAGAIALRLPGGSLPIKTATLSPLLLLLLLLLLLEPSPRAPCPTTACSRIAGLRTAPRSPTPLPPARFPCRATPRGTRGLLAASRRTGPREERSFAASTAGALRTSRSASTPASSPASPTEPEPTGLVSDPGSRTALPAEPPGDDEIPES